ncbi:MAG: gluconate 2-dehydrogenase subunit 3 family protein [Limnohabitans sp.]|nr:gluconate 2-dehydrogenase subunit 3 family protein [Limnohabitans sp.]
MKRREVIKKSAIVLGASLSAPTLLSLLKGCKSEPTIRWKPTFFTEKQAKLVSELTETIIPKTDLPGAKEVNVPQFIESYVAGVYKQEDRERFKKGLDAFAQKVKETSKDEFILLPKEEQLKIAEQWNNQEVPPFKAGGEKTFFIMMKELTIVGYCTSQVGATQLLKYDPIPGSYKGCIPFSEVGKTWAT